MKEIVLIRTKKESDWVSCQSIVSNLESAYRRSIIFKILDIHAIEDSNDDFEIYNVVTSIIKRKPSEVIFIDHRPHPAKLLSVLQKEAPDFKPSFTFHIFGDFVLDSSSWYQFNDILKNYNIKFICASIKHEELIRTFLNSKDSTSVVPFPVNKNQFFFNHSEREEVRRTLGLSELDFLFLYTGRISQQKNVLELVKTMSNALKFSGDNLYFYFAGPFDDLGIPYKGQKNPPGVYFQRWISVKEKINNSHIKYIYNLGTLDLRRMYNASDCFISISTHNDEDYGMAPAEALMCGLQTILTDWGGYGSFKSLADKFCTLLPVGHQKLRTLPDLSLLQKFVYKSFNNKMTTEERLALSKKAADKLSIESITHLLESMTKPHTPFTGFNSHFYKLSSIFKSNPYEPFLGPLGDYSEFFFETYNSYIKESSHD